MDKTEFKTAQLRVKAKCIIAEGCGGAFIYVTPARARILIDAGAAELVNAGSTQQTGIGPSEFKPTGALEKKSSAAVPAGHSIDSAPSSGTGTAAPLSASEEAPASPPRRSRKSNPVGA
jgi:hypothetical protein